MRPASPSRTLEASPTTAACKSLGSGNALSRLQPTQVGTLRDGFQILDRDCDGVVNHDDVADMLGQLGECSWRHTSGKPGPALTRLTMATLATGLPNGPSYLTPFFPPSRPTSISLAAFLNSLAEALAGLSPSSELLSAFSAFDDDDSGQVDWAELRAALLRPAAGSDPNERSLTAAEVDKIVDGFTGRRAFNRNMTAQLGAKKGDVFRYQEFVDSIMGSNGAGSEGASHETETDAGW